MKVLENLNFSKAIVELLPKLLGEALQIVVITTIVGFLFAIVFGFILALGRVSKKKALNHIIIVFQEFIRGTPLLVQMVYIYYVMPLFIEMFASIIGIEGFSVSISSMTAGIIGLAINYGTYISEVIRSSIISIDNGQKEAALALGFSNRQAMFRIVIPQAFRNSVPVFGNYLVMMVKDTSLMAYITAQEFLMVTKAYTAQTFLTIESYTILASVYLIICIPLSFVIRFIERKLNKGRR
ncbi:MAG TPA: amino acid ABC transporter permease [Lachnospiraceae bacterium]|jgi:amine acid ABC transporter, permease protein, 3-TM region, His/Glu/Gln/Arg/opine family|nr:amino acid ABC transporter permease [Lachnospiraceae bacterium]